MTSFTLVVINLTDLEFIKALVIIKYTEVLLVPTLGRAEQLDFLAKTSRTTRLAHSVTGAVFPVASELSVHAPLEQVSAIL